MHWAPTKLKHEPQESQPSEAVLTDDLEGQTVSRAAAIATCSSNKSDHNLGWEEREVFLMCLVASSPAYLITLVLVTFFALLEQITQNEWRRNLSNSQLWRIQSITSWLQGRVALHWGNTSRQRQSKKGKSKCLLLPGIVCRPLPPFRVGLALPKSPCLPLAQVQDIYKAIKLVPAECLS